MATVNEDGSPHNTPLFFMYNPEFTKLYWGSHHQSQHSQNVIRNSNAFVVIYDSINQGKGGLYITLTNADELSGAELEKALKIHNKFRRKYDKPPLDKSYYVDSDQRMYSADISKIEIYTATRNVAGHIAREIRVPINADQLVG
jgi:hypothetical protein